MTPLTKSRHGRETVVRPRKKGTNYSSGRGLEYSTRKRLMDRHWLVTRSAGSHTPLDLLAVRPALWGIDVRRVAVQCKKGSSPMTEEAFRELVRWAQAWEAIAIYVQSKNRVITPYIVNPQTLELTAVEWSYF